MKNTGILWIMSCVILTGCVHTSQIGNGESQTDPEEMFRTVTGEDVTVKLRIGETVQGKGLAVTADTLWLHLALSDSTLHLPMSEVESIETWGSFTGPLVGLVLGSVAGAAIGAMGGAAASEGSGFGAIAPAAGGAVGLGIGLVAGVTIGANSTPGHRFVIPDSGMPSARPQETKPGRYVIVLVKTILEETETSITIPWADGEVTLPKSKITITHTNDGFEIKVPRWLWYGEE